MGKAMPAMTRGAELEIQTVRDLEDLKHTLSQNMINVPNEVLRRAIIMPKDVDNTNGRYASPRDLLPKNPATDWEHIYKTKELNRVMKDVRRWQ